LGTKIAVAIALFLSVRMIVAQAPPAGGAVREDTDAQGYKYQVPTDELRKKKTEEARYRNKARAVLNGQESIAEPAARQVFKGFFLYYLYPMMTTEEGLKTIGKERQDLLRDLANSKNPDAHKEVVDFTIPAMTKIVQDPAYRPQARYNAMLILSSLNDVEPNTVGSAQTLPEPAKGTQRIILQQFQEADRDEIKLAALLGLTRHLEWDNYKQPPSTPMPAGGRNAIVKELVKLAEAKEPPAGRGADVHLWMRRRAVEGLTAACLTKADADIAAVMERLVRDEADSTSLRLAVATAMGRMSLQAPAKVDAVATAKELGYLALKACDAELTRAETYRKAEMEHQARLTGTYQGEGEYGAGPGGGLGGIGRMPGGEGSGVRPTLRPAPGIPGGGEGFGGELGVTDPSLQDPRHFEVEYLRRRMRQTLYAVQLGLLGGEDKAPPKPTKGAPGGAATPPPSPTTAPSAGGEKKEPRGMVAIAKAGDKERVEEVYFAVRKLAETIESDGADIDFHQLIKDARRDLKPLELVVGKRLQPAGAASALDDEPTIGKAKAGGKAAPGKAGPPRPAVPGKAANSSPRPQPNVFGQPRIGK